MRRPWRSAESLPPLRDEDLPRVRRRVTWARNNYRGWRRIPLPGRLAAQWDKRGADDAAAALNRITRLESEISQTNDAIEQTQADAALLTAHLTPDNRSERLADRSGLEGAASLIDRLQAVANDIAATRADTGRQAQETEQEMETLRERTASVRQQHAQLNSEQQGNADLIASLQASLASASNEYTVATNELQTLEAVRDALRHG